MYIAFREDIVYKQIQNLLIHKNASQIFPFAGFAKTYMYRCEMRPSVSTAPTWHTTDHSVELMYVFGAPFGHALQIEGPWHEDDELMAREMMKYWTNFAKTG